VNVFKLVRQYLNKYRLSVGIFVSLCILSWISSLIVPFITGKYIDILVNTRNKDTIILFIKILAIILIIDIVASYFKNLCLVKLKTNISFDLNYNILEHVKRLPLHYFHSTNTTYLNQRINSDSCNITNFILDNFVSVIINVLTFIAVAVFVMLISKKVLLLLFLIMPFYIVTCILFQKPIYKSEYEYMEIQNGFFSKMNDQLYKIKLAKINAWFECLGNELRKQYATLFNSAIKYSKISLLFSNFGLTVNHAAKILLFLICGIEVIDGKMSIGQLTTINIYFSTLLDCMNYFIGLNKVYQGALVSHTRIKEIIDIPVENNGTRKINNINDITFSDVSFSYGDGKKILENFNYWFKKGNIYCIVGKNGIGKSTLTSLMLGLFENYSGKILYDNIDIKEIDMYHTRNKLIGVTEQEPSLINDTILNNLLYGQIEISPSVAKMWSDKLKLNEFLAKLSYGINTKISEKSDNISGGEKQKISLARVLIKNPEVIILDEPTSALDNTSFKILKDTLLEIKSDKIIIAITHNQNMLDIADEIIYFGKECNNQYFDNKQTG
jgi:ABC-type bacteriocin/lantibiotic exporter with double-glycine peptidase domain